MNKKIRLKKAIKLMGYKEIPAGAVFDVLKSNARFVNISVNGKTVLLSKNDVELIERGKNGK